MEDNKKNKIIILSTLIWGLLAHAFRFFNVVLLGETVDSLTGQFFQISSGRWLCLYLQKFVQLIFGPLLELPWLGGIFCLLVISICNIILINLFEIKDKKHIIIISGILPTFVAVTSLFSYMFLAPLHIISMLLAVLSLKFIANIDINDKRKFLKDNILGIISGVLSLSIYQSYIGFTILGLFILSFKKIKELDNKKKLIYTLANYLISLFLILIIYILTNSIILKITGEQLSDWRNVNSVGSVFTIFNIKDGIKNAYKESLNTSYTNVFVGNLKYVYYFVVIYIFIHYIYNIYYMKKNNKDKFYLFLYVILMILSPLVFNYPFLSYMDNSGCATTVYYYQALVFFVLTISIESKNINKYIKYIVLAMLIYTNVYNCYISNTNYFLANEVEIKKQSWMTTLTANIQNIDEYHIGIKVILISEKANSNEAYSLTEIADETYNAELSTNYYPLMNFYHKLEITYNYIIKWSPLKIYVPEIEEQCEINNNEQYQNMPLYPNKNSIQYFHEYDAIIVKLK